MSRVTMRRHGAVKRRRELLVVLPSEVGAAAEGSWAPLLKALARRWRVFWIHAPRRGELLPLDGLGLDPVTLDVFPAIRRVLADYEVSGVVLLGTATVATCLERLHSFAHHLPYFAALDAPMGEDGSISGQMEAESTLALADMAVITPRSMAPRFQTLLHRAAVPWAAFDAHDRRAAARAALEIGARAPALFRRLNRRVAPSEARVAAFLDAGDAETAGRRAEEWRASFGHVRERSVWAPACGWARQAAGGWPEARWRFYEDRGGAVEGLGRAALASSRPETLFVTGEVRTHPLLVERTLTCAGALPGGAAVGCSRSNAAAGSWDEWLAFSHAWALRYKGSYRTVPRLSHDCILVGRAALESVGSFDPRLDWRLAVLDFCLRARQAGRRLLVAEDAVAQALAGPVAADGASRDAFLGKWRLDPLVLARS